jgi:GWxTD domain-containing protein
VLAPFPDAIHSDSVKVVTFMEIPYYSLQFVKEGDSYSAYYQASLSIRDKKGKDIEHIIWSDSIQVDLYSDTRSMMKNKKHFTEFNVPIGNRYEVVGELQDLDTRKKGILRKNIDLRSLGKKPSLLSPIFMLDLPGDWGFNKDKIPTRGYRVKEIGLGVDLKISGFVDKGDYEINIFLTNGTANDSLIQKFTGDGRSGYFSENIFIPSVKFNSLKNDFRISLFQGKKVDEQEISFSRYKPGISSYVDDVEVAIRQMRYILSNDERKVLKARLKEDKEQLFYQLWKERDPTPDTEHNELMEEYFQRVGYVNEHFSGWQPGWETDRGMIYILFGPPDEIQRSNPTAGNSAIYQIWNYFKINKQFVFRDQNGFGDYRLDTPFIGAGL